MSYTFSFNVTPPIGFSINAQTGLITIAATAAPVSGNLSGSVFDGVTTDIKAIPVILSALTINPLLSAVSQAIHRGGGRMVPIDIYFEPIIYRGGGQMVPSLILATTRAATFKGGQSLTIGAIQFVPTIAAILSGGQSQTVPAIILATVRAAISRGGQSQTIGAIQLVPTSGFTGISRGGQSQTIGAIRVMAISIQQGSSLTVAAGDSTTLNAQITAGSSTAGINQSVTWSIVSGTYSGYGSITSAGVLTVTNGAYQATGAMIVVRATSVADPTLTTTINIYAINKFTGIQVTPSVSSVGAGDVLTINSLLQGLGSDLNGSHVSLISVVVSQSGTNSVTLSGNSVTYTANSPAGTISINATFFYPAGNYQVQGSASVQNTGSSTNPAGLTIVPSYTVTRTGTELYTVLNYASLNDGDGNTGAGIGSGGDCAIVVNLGSAKAIKSVWIAGGFLSEAWNSPIAPYLNGGFLEYSSDGTTWTNHATIAGVTDVLGEYKQYNLVITAQYWRLRRASYCATSAFMLYT